VILIVFLEILKWHATLTIKDRHYPIRRVPVSDMCRA